MKSPSHEPYDLHANDIFSKPIRTYKEGKVTVKVYSPAHAEGTEIWGKQRRAPEITLPFRK